MCELLVNCWNTILKNFFKIFKIFIFHLLVSKKVNLYGNPRQSNALMQKNMSVIATPSIRWNLFIRIQTLQSQYAIIKRSSALVEKGYCQSTLTHKEHL